MVEPMSPLATLQRRLASGELRPTEVATECAARANGNVLRNTYLRFSEVELMQQARTLEAKYAEAGSRPALYGVPVSLKDCFDLAGTVTTCGSRYYAAAKRPAAKDSAMGERLRVAGALITGKTHLHSLAYGITGQSRDFGDCSQPRDAALLTGGSSSGAAASVQEGSAVVGIGTDTGGSIRVPAALCGLAGYRASHRLPYAAGPWEATAEGLWEGAAHLAASFDTVGILMRDARDLAPVATVLFGVGMELADETARVAFVGSDFLRECDADVLAAFDLWRTRITDAGEIDTSAWAGAEEIFAGIQAHEAAALHRGHYEKFEPAIAQRLAWGASLTEADLEPLRERREAMRAKILALFDEYEFVAMPCAPVSRLRVGEDQSAVRARLLRYTTPFSLAGLPVVAMPGEMIGGPLGTGMQIAAAPGQDAALLAYAGQLAQRVVDEA